MMYLLLTVWKLFAWTGRLIFNLKGHTDKLWTADFSTDGKKVVTASTDGTAKVWDVETGKLIINIKETKEGK